MKTVDIGEAMKRLPYLVDRAAEGEDVIVSRDGRPLARITRLAAPKRRVRFGVLKGRLTVPEDFDAPLPAGVLAGFEGR